MRLYIQFRLRSPLTLPLNYQQILQGFIYHRIEDQSFAKFLHEEGYMHGKRQFRLFAFSRLLGQAAINVKQKTITFENQVRWQVSSCLSKFIQEFGQGLLKSSDLQLAGHPVEIDELHYKNIRVEASQCTVRMLSPITIHSTYQAADGQKITQYFKPEDPAFAHLINENLAKKYMAYYDQPVMGRVEIKPLKVAEKDKVITRYKGFIIEGWNGMYALSGEPEMLTFACTAGLGGRNSYGFGLPEIVPDLPAR